MLSHNLLFFLKDTKIQSLYCVYVSFFFHGSQGYDICFLGVKKFNKHVCLSAGLGYDHTLDCYYKGLTLFSLGDPIEICSDCFDLSQERTFQLNAHSFVCLDKRALKFHANYPEILYQLPTIYSRTKIKCIQYNTIGKTLLE